LRGSNHFSDAAVHPGNQRNGLIIFMFTEANRGLKILTDKSTSFRIPGGMNIYVLIVHRNKHVFTDNPFSGNCFYVLGALSPAHPA
jgi:hypothetical protein